jgi:coenzyme F420-reducing hydrogenase delta subunit
VANTARVVTLFVCSNCARPAITPAQRNRSRTVIPELTLPFKVYEVELPCAGRLQPEHVLKVFEAGSDAACVVACDEANCHHSEGSRRCRRRVEYVGRILDEVGVGANRLILTHLRGSAKEDLTRGEAAATIGTSAGPSLSEDVASVRRELVTRINALPRNPLHQAVLPESDSPSLDDEDENED